MATSKKQQAAGLAHGWRSGLEESECQRLVSLGVAYEYEPFRIPYVPSTKMKHYTPDILLLDNGILVELKGRWLTADRAKHLLVRQQYSDLDIRLVFSNARAKIGKRSATTYAAYCDSKGFKWAHRTIPTEWLHEAPNKRSLAAIQKLLSGRKT